MWAALGNAIEAGLCWVAQNSGAIGVDLLLTALIAYPLGNFLLFGWLRKEYEVRTSLSDEAKRIYLEVFHRIVVTDAEAAARFDQLYRRWYGRRHFALPIAFVLLIALIENFIVGRAVILLAGTGKLDVASAAISGAYTFVTWDLFARMQRRDMSPADICRGALRLAVAIPVGYAFALLMSDSLGPFIAFAVGVFPIGALGEVLRQIANKRLGLEIGAATADDQVSKLSGIDMPIAARIADADITTIPQLSWCDPIQLSMRSNLAFGYVVDIVSQALAWVYLGDRIKDLRTMGLRGAFEIKAFLRDLNGDDPHPRQLAQNALPVAAQLSNCPEAGLLLAFDQIANDPNTNFLYEAA
jgi:hypothetical protein